jgi:hypothetical protein
LVVSKKCVMFANILTNKNFKKNMNKLTYILRTTFGLEVPAQKECKVCKTIIKLDGYNLLTVTEPTRCIGHNEINDLIATSVETTYRVCECPNCKYKVKLYQID